MIDNPPPMKISSDCCKYGKKDILHAAIKDGGYDLNLTGMRRAEGGARSTAFTSCFKENDAGCDLYMPVWWYTDTDKEIYREYYNIERSKCYTEYGLKRTGCAGCPYGRDFEKELEIIKQYEPKLYKAVNHIFGESYRYTRNYRAYVTFMEQKNNRK